MAVPSKIARGKAALAGKSNPGDTRLFGATSEKSEVFREVTDFINSWKQSRFLEIASIVTEEASTKTSGGKKKITVNVPKSALTGAGTASERALMQRLGWYWEPLLHDLNFFEEMLSSISLFDGSVQKLVDLALDGFRLQCEDPADTDEINETLVKNTKLRFKEQVRNAALDVYGLGNCYKVPRYDRDEKKQLYLKALQPIRASAMRMIRDEHLQTEGYVQLLHRPSEFIFGTPISPTIWLDDEVIYGQMRNKNWYAYGAPLPASSPFIVRLKLTMERDIAEMLHKHLPRIDIKFTPDEQLNEDQVLVETQKVKDSVAALKSTDDFIHTPDTEIEYKGPAGHALDFSPSQKHIEEQLFYFLPFSPAMMGRDSTANPYDSQQRWKLTAKTANSLRTALETMFAPVFEKIAKDRGIQGSIAFAWPELDPETQSQLAEAEEYHVANATAKRDAGFIDQDTAARQATGHHPDGPVKKAAAPGQLPPPIDPNKPAGPPGSSTPVRNRDKGPKGKNRKAPQSDKRTPGRRHAHTPFDDLTESALSRL